MFGFVYGVEGCWGVEVGGVSIFLAVVVYCEFMCFFNINNSLKHGDHSFSGTTNRLSYWSLIPQKIVSEHLYGNICSYVILYSV